MNKERFSDYIRVNGRAPMLYAELTAIIVAFLDLLQLIVLDASSKSVVDFLRKIQDLFINPCPQRQNKHSLNDQSSLYVIIPTISAASVPMSDRNSMSPKGGNKEVYFIRLLFFKFIKVFKSRARKTVWGGARGNSNSGVQSHPLRKSKSRS